MALKISEIWIKDARGHIAHFAPAISVILMGTVRKTIALTDRQDGWIKAQIDAGRYTRYTNDSECIRDLIRREQERSAEIDAIRAALIEGESSGEPRSFDASTFTLKILRAHG